MRINIDYSFSDLVVIDIFLSLCKLVNYWDYEKFIMRHSLWPGK